MNGVRNYRNELGDASVFVAWDANWCGQLAVRNVQKVMGFALAYARLGRGLIIYDGFDNDQNLERGYDQIAMRELSQGFDPDNLPCAVRLGDFVLPPTMPCASAGRCRAGPTRIRSPAVQPRLQGDRESLGIPVGGDAGTDRSVRAGRVA